MRFTFMIWMAVLLVWYVLTVLTGRRPRFALGAVVAAFMVILVLVAMNPEDLIARTNIARASEGKRMDVRYLSVLGNDAVPALANAFQNQSLPVTVREKVGRPSRLFSRRCRSNTMLTFRTKMWPTRVSRITPSARSITMSVVLPLLVRSCTSDTMKSMGSCD